MSAQLRTILRRVQVPKPIRQRVRSALRIDPLSRYRSVIAEFQDSDERRKAFFDAVRDDYLVACGPETFVVSTRDRIIGREVFGRGGFEFDIFERAIALANLPSGGTLIDVGANIGVTSIPAVMRGYVDRAIAIEPEPLNLRLLRTNVALNGLQDSVTIVACAAGEKDGRGELELSPDNLGDHRLKRAGAEDGTDDSGRDAVMVGIRTLDDILAGEDIGHGFLWIDVQGYEGYVLEGASRTLSRGFPLVIEFWPEAMRHNGSWTKLRQALLASPHSRLHDLREAGCPPMALTAENLDIVADRQAGPDGFTDLLIL